MPKKMFQAFLGAVVLFLVGFGLVVARLPQWGKGFILAAFVIMILWSFAVFLLAWDDRQQRKRGPRVLR